MSLPNFPHRFNHKFFMKIMSGLKLISLQHWLKLNFDFLDSQNLTLCIGSVILLFGTTMVCALYDPCVKYFPESNFCNCFKFQKMLFSITPPFPLFKLLCLTQCTASKGVISACWLKIKKADI